MQMNAEKEKWYVLVSNHERAKAFAVVGPYPTEGEAEDVGRSSGCGYYRVGTKP